MAKADEESLHADIKKNGILHPLDVTPDGRILDGVHRWMCAKELALVTLPVVVYRYEYPEEEDLHALRANLNRRQLTEGQKAVLGLDMLPVEEELARRRKAEAARQQVQAQARTGQGHFSGPESGLLSINSKPASKPNQEQPRAAEKVAGVVGVSAPTIYRAKAVAEKKPELLDAVRSGSMSVNKAYQLVQAEENAEKVRDALASGRDLDDLEIMEQLDIPLRPYDVWNFPTCDDRFGFDYPGRIPGQLVAHCLYFWTEKGDTVLDPMSGSGTTWDVCNAMGRRCLAYDAHPHVNRPEIQKHDMSKGWPSNTEQAALIFWDPPYYKKKDGGYGDKSISRRSKVEYMAFFENAARSVPVGFSGRLALLCSDYNDEDNPDENIWYWDYVNLFAANNWRVERHIQVPLSTQMIHPDIVQKFRRQKRLARLGRDLVVFRRD